MSSASLELPLFRRYHAIALSSGKFHAELAALGLQVKAAAGASSTDVLWLETLDAQPLSDRPAALAAAGAVLDRTVMKSVDANYWLGAQLGDNSTFSDAVDEVHAAVRLHSQVSLGLSLSVSLSVW